MCWVIVAVFVALGRLFWLLWVPLKGLRTSRAPKDHMNIRIPETMISDIHLHIGPLNQNVRSLSLCAHVIL